ncbi:MAG: hypothetical protein ACRD2O_14215, partial [Terriglobia bacterium]
MASEQDPDCLSSHFRRQLAFHGLLGNQTHGPAAIALGRIAANHGDDALPRAFVVSTDSDHGFEVYLNLAGRMKLTGIDQLWV